MMAVGLKEQMFNMCVFQVTRQKYVDMQILVRVMLAKICYKSMYILYTISNYN
jgi:hypothetical protein